MSKFLHYGQILPVWLALEAKKHSAAGRKSIESFIEELLVRRELALNWCEFNPRYDCSESLPDWSRKPLPNTRAIRARISIPARSLAQAATQDPYWNAAMNEMVFTG